MQPSETPVTKEDIQELMGQESPAPAETPELSAAPVATETAPAETPAATETPATPAKEPDTIDVWNRQLAKTQKDLAILRDQTASDRKLHEQNQKLLRQLAEQSGIQLDPEPEPAPKVVEPSEEVKRVKSLEREVKFLRIQQQYPGADPDAMDKQAWAKALEFFDIPQDAQEMPDGITAAALYKARDKYFAEQVAALAAKKKAVPTPAVTSPPRHLPPPSPGSRGVQQVPATHVPAPRTVQDDLRQDLLDLVGGVG